MPIIDLENYDMSNQSVITDLFYVSNPSPLVVLFGPAASGKTMALIRLTRYLHMKGYSVVPDRSFRPAYNHIYQEVCDSFYPHMCCDGYAARSTSSYEMLLVKVIDRQGEIVCQLLDVPGSFFFDPIIPQEPWCKSIDYIRNLRNKRVWLYFVEEGWRDGETRTRYAQRIRRHVFDSSEADKSVFVFSKVDNTNYLKNSMEEVNMPELFKAIGYQYPDIFAPFAIKPPLKWFKKYNCRFAPFSSGRYYPQIDESGVPREEYLMGPDVFPKMIWDAILRSIK